jgi:hypothetical protein
MMRRVEKGWVVWRNGISGVFTFGEWKNMVRFIEMCIR